MTRLAAALLGIVLAGCAVAPSPSPGTASPSPGTTPTRPAPPTPSPAPTPTPTPTPTSNPRDLGNTGDLELLVAHVVDDAPYFDVVVDAVTATGAQRTVGRVSDVHPASWEEARPMPGGRISVSEEGYLLIPVERGGGGTADSEMRLVYDLVRPAVGPVELPSDGGTPSWGPDGRLAWVVDAQAEDPLGPPQRLIVARPTAGLVSGNAVPADVLATGIWAAGGEGWLASRTTDLAAGVLGEDLVFEAGPAAAYERTGVERLHSVRGGSLATGVSDGPAGPEYELQEYGLAIPGACRCVAWMPWTADVVTRSTAWDRHADGVWLVASDAADTRRWLEHRTRPGVAARIAELPAGDWRIVGRSPDDAMIVLEGTAARRVLVVDPATGAVTVVAEAMPDAVVGPAFAGWLGG